MFAYRRFPDDRKEYWAIYHKTHARMESWTTKELLRFLATFSLFKKIWMNIFYHQDAVAYRAAKDILKNRN